MRTPVSPALAALARLIVSRELGAVRDGSVAVAQKLEVVFSRLEDVTAAMVGDVGYAALVTRAMTVTRKAFPWLPSSSANPGNAEAVSNDSPAFPRARWETVLVDQEAELVIAAATALLANVLGLVASFVGEDFTFRLVGRAWPDEDPGAAGSRSGET